MPTSRGTNGTCTGTCTPVPFGVIGRGKRYGTVQAPIGAYRCTPPNGADVNQEKQSLSLAKIEPTQKGHSTTTEKLPKPKPGKFAYGIFNRSFSDDNRTENTTQTQAPQC